MDLNLKEDQIPHPEKVREWTTDHWRRYLRGFITVNQQLIRELEAARLEINRLERARWGYRINALLSRMRAAAFNPFGKVTRSKKRKLLHGA